MWTTWAPIVPAVAIALCLIILPGLLVGRAMRLPLLQTVTFAPVLSILAITASAWAASLLGQHWHIGWAAGITIAMAAALFGVGTLSRRLGWHRLYLMRTAHPPTRAQATAACLQYVIGIVVMAIAMVPRYLAALGHPGNFLQRFDNAFHLNAIRWIADTGQASSFDLGFMVNSSIYPLGWHQLNALAMEVSGTSLTGTVFACFLVTIFVVWPLSLAALLESITRPTKWARMALGPLALSFMAFPHITLEGGGLYANLFGLAVAPAVLASLIMLTQLGERIHLAAVPALALAILAMLGSASAHPNATMLSAAASLPALWWSAWLLHRRGPELAEHEGPRVPSKLWGIGVFFVTVMLAVGWLVLAPGLEVAPWPQFETIPQAIGEIATATTLGKQAIWSGTFLYITGIVFLARRRPALLWLVACHLVIAGFYLVTAAFGVGQLRNMITGVFYNDARRTGSALGILVVIFALMAVDGLVWLAKRKLDGWRPALGERFRRHERWLAVLLCLLLAASTLPNRGLNRQLETLHWAYSYRYVGDVIVSPDELRMIYRIPDLVPQDAVIANIPLDGSGLIYAFTGHPVLNYYMFQRDTDDIDYINRHLFEVATNPKVCPLLEEYNVQYLIDLAPNMIGNFEYLEDYGGLDIWSWTPGFEPVDSVGRTTLYRITACD